MEKFISIPTGLGANQLVSVNDLVGVFAGSGGTNTAALANTVLIYRNGKTITLTHAAQTAYNMRNAIQDAIVESLKVNWTKPVGYVIPSLPIAVTNLAISG
jgi:hypothetical protein